MDKREFMRSKCFMFFASYLEGADKIKGQFGAEVGYDYLTGIIRYALYREESDNPLTNALVSALKDTIDAGQEKRENGFNRENVELTEKILEYKAENPTASQQKIAEAVGCSVGKVSKVLKKQGTVTTTVPVSDTRVVSNNTDNINNTFTSNLNSVSVSVNEESHADTTKAAVPALKKEEKRALEDLDDKELKKLMRDLKAGKKAGLTYGVLYKTYNLQDYILSPDTVEEIETLLNERKRLDNLKKQEEEIDLVFKKCPHLLEVDWE